MNPSLITPRMVANAIQSAIDAGAVYDYLRRERVWQALRRRWDPAWRVRAPDSALRFRTTGYSVEVR